MPGPKANILVAFYSRDGSIEALAKAISEGAREAGAEVRLRRVPDIASTAVMGKMPGGGSAAKGSSARTGPPGQPTHSGARESYFAPPPDSLIRSRSCGQSLRTCAG